jgi:GntR family transcriptional regulator
MPQDLHHRLEAVINATEPGDKLLSEPKLAKQLGVSRATLREAMRTFETQGRLSRRQGVGTFVVQPSRVIESGLELLESIETLAERIDLPVSMGELDIRNWIADNETAGKLDVEPGTEVLLVSRTILVEDQPVAYLIDKLPRHYLRRRDVDSGFTGSVLDLLLKRGDPPLGNSRCEIDAVAASSSVARALNIQRGDSLLCFEAMLYSATGEPVDFSLSYFLPGYFNFHVVRTVGR